MKKVESAAKIKATKMDYLALESLRKQLKSKWTFFFGESPDFNKKICNDKRVFIFESEKLEWKEISNIGDKSILGFSLLSMFKKGDSFSNIGILDQKTEKLYTHPVSLSELEKWKKTFRNELKEFPKNGPILYPDNYIMQQYGEKIPLRR
jgi:hypothetical protein